MARSKRARRAATPTRGAPAKKRASAKRTAASDLQRKRPASADGGARRPAAPAGGKPPAPARETSATVAPRRARAQHAVAEPAPAGPDDTERALAESARRARDRAERAGAESASTTGAVVAAAPSPAETDLLALARALTEMTSPDPSPGDAVTTALDALAAAFEADAPLPRALAHARNAALADHSLALALAWAREQLRLSLGEILDRAVAAGDVRVSLPPESLAWLVLAACEALAHEPRGAAPDRLKLLAEWLRGD